MQTDFAFQVLAWTAYGVGNPGTRGIRGPHAGFDPLSPPILHVASRHPARSTGDRPIPFSVDQRLMRLIFVPSMLRLAIRPCWSEM